MKNIFSDLFSGNQKSWPLVIVFGLAVLYGDLLWWQAQKTVSMMDYQAAMISSAYRWQPNARATALIKKQLNEIQTQDIGKEFEQIDADLGGL